MPSHKLFEPLLAGNLPLNHRVVLAPLTRFRATQDHVPTAIMKEYYTQRASCPGTLLITEATFIAPQEAAYEYVPGIWSPEQISAWKEITDSVHSRGSFIYVQLWGLGRAANEHILEKKGLPYVAPSAIAITGHTGTPRALTLDEITQYSVLYAQAAKNAIEAGFDGVEIHGANGYLLDQFFQDVSNTRTDVYGGSIENRARFGLEIVDAVVKAIGVKNTSIRLSPWSPFQDMGMENPIPTFSYIITELKQRFPDLAYIHLIEPRIAGGYDVVSRWEGTGVETNQDLAAIWTPKPLIWAGGFTRESAIQKAQEIPGSLIALGRYFISNPDVVEKMRRGLPLTPYDRGTFFSHDEKGYIDYSYSDDTEIVPV